MEKQVSERVKNAKIAIIKEKCPHCHHNKAWSKNAGVFCAKCGKEI